MDPRGQSAAGRDLGKERPGQVSPKRRGLGAAGRGWVCILWTTSHRRDVRAGVMDAVRLRLSKLTLAAGERLRQVLPSPFQMCRVAVRREVDAC